MNDTQLETLARVQRFLDGTEAISFQIERKDARYRWIQQTLVKFRYMKLSKANKGLITRFIRKMTGYSLAQVKRLIKQYRKHRRLERKHRTTEGFQLKYTREDKLWADGVRYRMTNTKNFYTKLKVFAVRDLTLVFC